MFSFAMLCWFLAKPPVIKFEAPAIQGGQIVIVTDREKMKAHKNR